MFEFVLLKHKMSLLTKIENELSDIDFNSGWRFVKYLKNSEIDYVSYIADTQEFNDKSNNERPVEHDEIKYDKPLKPTLFNSVDNWRYR